MDLKIFEQRNWKVRTVLKNNKPWFAAKDVCCCLEIQNPRDSVSRLDDDERGVVKTDTPGGMQNITVVSESGLYSLIFKSRKQEAKNFKKWITSEVIPSIRETGSYSIYTPSYQIEDPIKRAEKWIEEQKRLLLAEKTIEEQKPKVEFANAIKGSESSISVGAFAKAHCNYGRNTLFRIMRENGILRDNNEPYQKYVNQGYFEVTESIIERSDGDKIITITLITGKGQLWISKNIKEWERKL